MPVVQNFQAKILTTIILTGENQFLIFSGIT